MPARKAVTKSKKISIPMEEALKKQITARAQQNRRTIVSETLFIIDRGLESLTSSEDVYCKDQAKYDASLYRKLRKPAEAQP